jgi:hypothetical protein
LNQSGDSIDCASVEFGSETNFSCREASDLDLFVDGNTGDVWCRADPNTVERSRIEEGVKDTTLLAFVAFSGYAFGVGIAMIVLGGKGLMKQMRWAYRPSIYLSAVMIGMTIGVLVFSASYLVPRIASLSPAMIDSFVFLEMLDAFLVQFIVQLIAGLVSLIILFRLPKSLLTNSD